MSRFSARLAASALSIVLSAGIVAFADPANAVPAGHATPVMAVAASMLAQVSTQAGGIVRG